MIPLINHDSQWGRSEVVIICPSVLGTPWLWKPQETRCQIPPKLAKLVRLDRDMAMTNNNGFHRTRIGWDLIDSIRSIIYIYIPYDIYIYVLYDIYIYTHYMIYIYTYIYNYIYTGFYLYLRVYIYTYDCVYYIIYMSLLTATRLQRWFVCWLFLFAPLS